MKKKLPVLIGIAITLFIACLYGNTNKTHKIYDNNVNTAVYQAIGTLSEGEIISQTFVCQEDILNGFVLKSDVLGDYEDTQVMIRVLDGNTGEILAEGQEIGKNIHAREQHYYKIDPINGCKGKKLILQVSEKGASENNGINLFYQPRGGSEEEFVVKGNETTGVFVMKTVTERFDVETFAVMLFAEWFIWGFLWFLYRLFR